jgi:hypothetical protein
MSTKSPNALLVFPKFNPNSFWNLQAVCDVWGAGPRLRSFPQVLHDVKGSRDEGIARVVASLRLVKP